MILEAIVILRPPRPKVEGTADESQDVPLHWASLSAIGAIAGWSSGFLGIGGGLAITALPVTLPAALLYVQQGTALPWLTIISLIVGLWVGTDVGARFANRVSPNRLRVVLMIMIAGMAIFMAFKAWR